jgi:hypothetical protein
LWKKIFSPYLIRKWEKVLFCVNISYKVQIPLLNDRFSW